MRKTIVLTLVLSLGAVSALVWGGGFWIEASAPAATSQAGAVLQVRPLGCHDPSDASFRASAEGLVNGVRKSIELKRVRDRDGALVIERQWPEQGRWVLAISGTYRGHTRSLLLQIDSSTGLPVMPRSDSRMLTRALTETDIAAVLASLSEGD